MHLGVGVVVQKAGGLEEGRQSAAHRSPPQLPGPAYSGAPNPVPSISQNLDLRQDRIIAVFMSFIFEIDKTRRVTPWGFESLWNSRPTERKRRDGVADLFQ